MAAKTYEQLKLDNQICFPLYAASREVIKRYRPHLDALNLTYTQYITMMVIWEQRKISVKDLGEKLFLDSGTLTPVLKSMENKGYVTRYRSSEDERVLLVEITDKGDELRDKVADIPMQIAGCMKLEQEEALELHRLLHKLLDEMKE